jgi:uncharacterized protein (UPF0332 family)
MPESEDYLAQAEAAPIEAHAALKAHLARTAMREAYTMALNAARAILFEKTGLAARTHGGTRTSFEKLIRDGLAFDAGLLEVLRGGFDAKQRIDYGPPKLILIEDAIRYIALADAFIEAARKIVRG